MPKLPIPRFSYSWTALIISHFIRIVLVIAVAGSIWKKEWLTLFLSFMALFLTFLPAIIKRNYRITLPIELEFFVVIFLFSSLFLGEIHGYYTRYWWWDIVLHASSAIVFGFLGFLIIYSLYISKKVRMGPAFVALFSFCFALALGASWEVFEFSLDSFVGTHMQNSSLVDTMWDLILDASGAFVMAVAGYFYVKFGKLRGLNAMLARFEKANPHLFS